jgi:hypothetical protein
MSELSVGQLKGLPINNNVVTVPAGQTLYAPGHVLQVVSTTKTDTAASNTTSYQDIPGMSVTITPKSATSKIFIGVTMTFGVDSDCWISTKLFRGSTDIFTASSMRFNSVAEMRSGTGFFLDSPNTTSPTTYKIQWSNLLAGGAVMTFNRRGFDTGVVAHSTIYALEIAA